MTRFFFIFALAIVLFSSSARSQSLWDELLDTTEHRLKTKGPDRDIAQFLATTPAMWERREAFFALSRDYIDGSDAAKVSGALEILYRLRGYRPMEWIGGPSFEEANADFFHKIDRVVFEHFPHFKSLQNDDVYNSLSLYLGTASSAEARRQLKEIAEATTHNEQTLICLAWQRNPEDMEFLLPFMLADTGISRSLPYHFRNSYGPAAIPYLRRAASEAKSKATREQAREELKHLEH
jgi:hypothetical protein